MLAAHLLLICFKGNVQNLLCVPNMENLQHSEEAQ
jgi:hypothetical protein